MFDLSHLLLSAQAGDPQATSELAALRYEELRTLARRESLLANVSEITVQ